MNESFTLRPYQIKDCSFYIQNPKCANLSDPGTGKTPSVCTYIGDYLWARKNVKVAWAMPKSLLEKNQEELVRFSHLENHDIQIVDGDISTRAAQLRSKAPVILMGFKRLSDDYEVLLQDPNLKACVVDEFHLGFGGAESIRTQNWWRFMRRMWYFVGMTGTLIDGRLDSAYPLIQAVAPQIYGNYNFFMNRHAIYDLDGRVVDWKNHDFLSRVLERFCIRHSFESVYGEAKKSIEVQDCYLSNHHMAIYNDMEQEAIVDLGDEWLEAVNEGVKAIRCRQILAHPETFGFDFGETDKDRKIKEHLAEGIETKKPLIVFASLIPELNRIAEISRSMGLRTGVLHSQVNVNRGEIDRSFRAGELDVICATPAIAGVGFNWDHVDTMVFVSIDYKDSNWKQAIQRAIRGTREVPLKVYLLRYPGTVEDKIIASIERKALSAHKVDPTNTLIDIFDKQKAKTAEAQRKAQGKIWGGAGPLTMDALMD